MSNGSRDEMERDVTAMHGYGLWATMQKDSIDGSHLRVLAFAKGRRADPPG